MSACALTADRLRNPQRIATAAAQAAPKLYMMFDSSKVRPRPMNERIVSIIDQVFMV